MALSKSLMSLKIVIIILCVRHTLGILVLEGAYGIWNSTGMFLKKGCIGWLGQRFFMHVP
jgi:hypothetical protein